MHTGLPEIKTPFLYGTLLYLIPLSFLDERFDDMQKLIPYMTVCFREAPKIFQN